MGPRVRARLPDAVSHPIIIPYVCGVCVGGGGGDFNLGTKLMEMSIERW